MWAKDYFYRKLIMVLLLVGVISSCATDKVTWDLTEYVNQGILNISQLEESSLKHYAMATGANYTTDQNFYLALKRDVIPEYKRFLTLLKQIKPNTLEVRRVHSIYIRGAEDIYRGFKLKMLGLETDDELLIRLGNEKIEAGRAQTEKWRMEMANLGEAHQKGWVLDLWGKQ